MLKSSTDLSVTPIISHYVSFLGAFNNTCERSLDNFGNKVSNHASLCSGELANLGSMTSVKKLTNYESKTDGS